MIDYEISRRVRLVALGDSRNLMQGHVYCM
jgi:hypothetical protein